MHLLSVPLLKEDTKRRRIMWALSLKTLAECQQLLAAVVLSGLPWQSCSVRNKK